MSNNELAILIVLLEHKEKLLSIRQIAQISGINYRIAYQTIHQLHKIGIVALQIVGKSKICSLATLPHPLIIHAEYVRRQDIISNNKNIAVLSKLLNEIPQLYIAVLFGSQAKMSASKKSDIDVLFIGNNLDSIQTELELLSIPVHATYLSIENFKKLAKQREFNVVTQALKKNIILVGCEDYYRLLQ